MASFKEKIDMLGESERILLELIRCNGIVSRQDLLGWTGARPSTLHRSMSWLESQGLIMQAGKSDSMGGRKSSLYTIAKGYGALIGTEISRTEVRVTICRPNLEWMDTQTAMLDAHHGPDETSGLVADLLWKALRVTGLSCDEVIGMGLGIVGPMDREKGTLIHPQGFLHPAWGGGGRGGRSHRRNVVRTRWGCPFSWIMV